MSRIFKIALLSLALILASFSAHALESIYTLDDRSPVEVTHSLYLEDRDRTIDLDTILKLEESQKEIWKSTDKLNFGYIPSRIWFKLVVTNPTDTTEWLFEQQFPLIQYLHFYFKKEGKISHEWAGRARPFHERLVNHKNLLFPFELKKGETATLYLSYYSAGPILAVPRFLSKDTSITETSHGLLLYGLYYGVLIAMVIYNLFLFIGTRDSTYLFYVLYTLSFCFFHMCLSGIAYQYIWPNAVKWNNIASFVLIPLSYVFVAIFTKVFLETKKYSPRADKILNGVIIVSSFLSVLPFFYYNYKVSKTTGYAMFSSSFFLFAASVLCYRAGARNVKYFIIAFAGIMVANSLYAARAIGFIRDNFITNHGIQIASTAEVFLFSLGLVARIKRLQDEQENQRSVAKMASEISHNIKSPLAALSAVTPMIRDSDESIRTLIRYSINSITDLANQLLELRRLTELEMNKKREILSNKIECEFIPGLVEQIISQKKIEYNRYDLIHYNLPEDDLFVFVNINHIQFRSIISNLINNSVDAVSENGRIHVSVWTQPNRVFVSVKDNGRGMTQEKINSIRNKTYVSDKPKGNGVGLIHAIDSIKRWGGSLSIESKENEGSTLTIELPRAKTPSWFATEVKVKPGSTIVVLDDDTAIHKIWDQRILNDKRFYNIQIEHFSDGKLFLERFPLLDQATSLFLVDQELLRQEKTGLDIIEQLNIQTRSILVTSRWDEHDVVSRARKLGLSIIPKLLAGKIPLTPEKTTMSRDSLITHSFQTPSQLNNAVEITRKRITQNSTNLSTSELEERLSLLEQLSQFEFGQFLIIHGGINGKWTQYMVLYPKNGKTTGLSSDGSILSPLEKWLLEECPIILATQERFRHFQETLQTLIKTGAKLASVPCGLMDDLLTLNVDQNQSPSFVGIDLDGDSLIASAHNAEKLGLKHLTQFQQTDAWKIDIQNEFDVITSNGLNIYEPMNERVVDLYQRFWNALKPGGILVTSFLTPSPFVDPRSPWKMDLLALEDLRLQKLLFVDLLQTKWQVYRSIELTEAQLLTAGFKEVQFIYDKRGMFPTVVAKK